MIHYTMPINLVTVVGMIGVSVTTGYPYYIQPIYSFNGGTLTEYQHRIATVSGGTVLYWKLATIGTNNVPDTDLISGSISPTSGVWNTIFSNQSVYLYPNKFYYMMFWVSDPAHRSDLQAGGHLYGQFMTNDIPVCPLAWDGTTLTSLSSSNNMFRRMYRIGEKWYGNPFVGSTSVTGSALGNSYRFPFPVPVYGASINLTSSYALGTSKTIRVSLMSLQSGSFLPADVIAQSTQPLNAIAHSTYSRHVFCIFDNVYSLSEFAIVMELDDGSTVQMPSLYSDNSGDNARIDAIFPHTRVVRKVSGTWQVATYSTLGTYLIGGVVPFVQPFHEGRVPLGVVPGMVQA